MDRKLLDYLPPVLRDVMEMQAINEANEPEIRLAWEAIDRVLANQFLEDADEHGVSIWERELLIYPKDTDTLEARKARIKAMWNLELPYTFTWLRHWLTGICGATGHTEGITDYTINVRLDNNVLPNAEALAEEILEMLLTVRPCNMLVLMTASLESTGRAVVAAHTEMSRYTEIWPYIVNSLETTGTVQHGAYTEYANRLHVWPLLTTQMESTGSAVMVGALEYRAKVEIYPND